MTLNTAGPMRHFVLIRFKETGWVGLWHVHDGQQRGGYDTRQLALQWAERIIGASDDRTEWCVAELPT